MEFEFSVGTIVMQPTTLCNLNCHYCYLPERAKNKVMSPAVAQRVASELAATTEVVEIVWHAGEPLSIGLKKFTQLVAPFESLRKQGVLTHAIQTNATLINEAWCEFFITYGFRVGVSIDGPSWTNVRRVDRGNNPAHAKIMKGIECLKKADIPFSAISVIGDDALGSAVEIYEFFRELGCNSLGINRDEQLGVYSNTEKEDNEGTTKFWEQLFIVWKNDQTMNVRDFSRVLPSLTALSSGGGDPPDTYDLFPCVSWNGDIVVLAPEFLNTTTSKYGTFVIGNVTKKKFSEIIDDATSAQYVRDFVRGVTRCSETCQYFPICYGGQAGNKYFEHDSTDATETVFCRNSEQRLANAVLNVLTL